MSGNILQSDNDIVLKQFGEYDERLDRIENTMENRFKEILEKLEAKVTRSV